MIQKNAADQKQARCDQLDDRQFDGDAFDLKMFKTESQKSKYGKAEAYDVYFGKEHEGNIQAAIKSFKMRNKSEPNALQIYGMERFLETHQQTKLIKFKMTTPSSNAKKEEEEEEEKGANENGKTKVLITPVKEKKNSAGYDIYFDDKEQENEESAIKWFARFNNRKPTALELKDIQKFVKHDKSELVECGYDLGSDDCKQSASEHDAQRRLKMKTSFAVKKSSGSTKYTLDFVDEEARTSGNNKQALKWFEIFNSRKPNKQEQAAISNFVKADMEEVIDID